MSKQDMKMARSPTDLERKYDLASIAGLKKAVKTSETRITKTNKTLENFVNETTKNMIKLQDEMTVNLVIESSKGTVFKQGNIETVLSVIIYRGSQRITDMETLKRAMGTGAYLQWKWQRLEDETFGVISASDSHIGNDGFTYTISAEEIDTKVTFLCELIIGEGD